MKILILGAGGLLGRVLCRQLASVYDIVPLSRQDLDITHYDSVLAILESTQADVVINCAALMNADVCEDRPKDSYAINFLGVKNIVMAMEASCSKAIFVHFSSDYVFDGAQGNYQENDVPLPIGVYGLHKWAADELIQASQLKRYYILRVASVLSADPKSRDFSKTIVKNLVLRGELKVIDDIRVSVSSDQFIATTLLKIFSKQIPFGLYHCVSSNSATWYELSCQIMKTLKLQGKIKPCSQTEYPTQANRPANSSLNVKKLSDALGEPLPTWEAILHDLLKNNPKIYAEICANALSST